MTSPSAVRVALLAAAACSCTSDGHAASQVDAAGADTFPTQDASEALAAENVMPSIGSVQGGMDLTLRGHGFSPSTRVAIGPYNCSPVTYQSSELISCVTPTTKFLEGQFDVVVTDGAQQVTLPRAFTYECPWTTSLGRRSCGAVPAPHVAPQTTSTWITQFQAGHGFTVDPDGGGASDLADAADFTLGTQAVWVETDGSGTSRELRKLGMPPIDLTNQDVKIWIKVDGIAHLAALELVVGDSTLANAFRFRLRSSQGQQWMTDGDWVSLAIPWAASNYSVVGTPDRTAITGIALHVADDATGAHVRVHVNGLATVTEPLVRFPNGVVSFTFDDNYASMVDPGASTLAQHGFTGTAYVIVDMVDKPGRASLSALHDLQAAGWDVSVHAATDAHHAARYPSLTAAEVEDDMVDARAWLIANGFRGYNHCAYPGGAFKTDSNAVLALASTYFTSCRTIYQRQQETFLPSDANKLRVLYVTSDVPLAVVEQRVDEARASREWLILVFHQLVDGAPATSTQWNAGDFAELASYIAASGIPVRPVGEVLEP